MYAILWYNMAKISYSKGNYSMKFNKNSYREFQNKEEAVEWGKEHYGYWLPKLQDQDTDAQIPAEKFFRSYARGSPSVYNNILRYNNINTYDFTNYPISKDEIIGGAAEINKNFLSENIVVYRYVSPIVLREMKTWGNIKYIRKNSILTDKGFFSTTLSLDSVTERDYAQKKNNFIFKIYVPKGTPCVYVGLIVGMNENEMLFAPNIKLKVLTNCWFSRNIECIVINV